VNLKLFSCSNNLVFLIILYLCASMFMHYKAFLSFFSRKKLMRMSGHFSLLEAHHWKIHTQTLHHLGCQINPGLKLFMHLI
jgi:hypothetical protein